MTIPTEPRVESHAIESAALARLWGYLRRAGRLDQQLDQQAEDAVRDAFVQGFKAGCRFAVQSTAALSNVEFRQAIALLAEVVRSEEP